ncbi:MAG: polyhydroxyalkanoate synthesis repressor PhaR [Lautropia sp.]|nr:polyhydroxyalkanoate synthesis repressor PhaR [Lautropia sp.]
MPTPVRLIKKYPNRRLYDTQTSVYITLADVKQLVLDNESFQVVDAKTNEDLTRSILLQIILDEEAGGTPLFSSQMLAQMIRFYGHAMQGMMGTYMEKTLQTFVEVQNRMQEQSKPLYEGRGVPAAELWAQFMQGQAPMMQSMMSNYIDQSKNLFFQMQEQMQQQARNVFSNFPGAFQQPPAAGEEAPNPPAPGADDTTEAKPDDGSDEGSKR